MKRLMLGMVGILWMVALSGCQQPPPTASADAPPPPPTITDALFYDHNNHDNVAIVGEFFPIKPAQRADVIASPNGTAWKPAIRILQASPTEMRATLPYGPEFPRVWVRVYGMNGQYSEPFLVHF